MSVGYDSSDSETKVIETNIAPIPVSQISIASDVSVEVVEKRVDHGSNQRSLKVTIYHCSSESKSQRNTQIKTAYSQDLCWIEKTESVHILRVKELEIISLLKAMILALQIDLSQSIRWEIVTSCDYLKPGIPGTQVTASICQSIYCQGIDPLVFQFSAQEHFDETESS